MFSEGAGLIEQMSTYRNIALHSLGASNPIIGDAYQIRCSSGPYGEIPYLAFPLYDDVSELREIEAAASKGILKYPTEADGERFLGCSRSCRDGLEFSYDSFTRLLDIANAMAKEIDVEPRTFHITDKDIIDAKFTNAEGQVSRMKRDPHTGSLIEY